jgi:putative endonuclease
MNSYIKSKIPGLGGRGENAAAVYLQRKGYKIIERNYRTKYGEIDIVAKDPEGILVFVEVKTLSDNSAGNLDSARDLLPEDNLSGWKLYKLQRICQFFANAYPALVDKNGWQIDLVAIIIKSETYKIKHYRNIH